MGLLARQAGVTSAHPISPPAAFTPSPQQASFLTGLQVTEQHLLLEARAGSGKSTTCREGARRLPRGQRSVYCCFNKAIADEFQRDLPSSCRAATLHSLGMRILRDAFGTVEIEGDKADRLAEQFFPGPRERPERYAVARLAALCKNLLLDGEDAGELRRLAAIYNVELLERTEADVLAVVPEILQHCIHQTATIDFDDMIWLPVMLGLGVSRSPDVLFVDEAQDLNPCQHALLPLLCPGGRLVVVGDRFQSIYAFRGADSDSIPKLEFGLAASDRGLARFPLTVTRRCPRSHVELAQRLVPDLDHLPLAPEGEIDQVGAEKWTDEVAPGDMILCRTNGPLVSACYRLIRSGTKATVRGRNIGEGILTLIARLRQREVSGLVRALEDHRAAELTKLAGLRNPSGAVTSLNDRCDCLKALTESATTVDEVRARAESMFTDLAEDNCVELSSVHRAKGLERRNILILRPDMLPGPWAETETDLQQERNLAYVAVTRSRHRLIFAGDIPSLFDEVEDSADDEE